jgi:hypothetical protein
MSMAEQAEVLESAATPEVQQAAEAMGWQPPTRYKGPPEAFVDAEEYMKRAETVLPIVRSQNQRLRDELRSVSEQNRATQTALAKAQEAIEKMELQHSVATARAVEQAKADVKAQLAAASDAGDHKGVADLTEQLVKLNAFEPPKEEKKEAPKALEPPPMHPDLVAFVNENPWWGNDTRKTSLYLGIATEFERDMREGRRPPLQGKPFFAAVKEEMEQVFAPAPRPRSKVEGGNGGGGEPPSNEPSFASLPADARAQCDKDAKQFVGPNKRYKTLAEWRKEFIMLYNA